MLHPDPEPFSFLAFSLQKLLRGGIIAALSNP